MTIEPDEYLVERIRGALAELAELGITVRVTPEMVFLTGDVGTPERKEEVEAAVAALVNGRTVRNGLTVVDLAEVDAEEIIP